MTYQEKTPVEAVEAVWDDQGLDGHLGMTVEHVGDGTARVSLVISRIHLNLFGTGHGGTFFALADSAFALACNSRLQVNVASGCHMEFLKPAMVGDKLTAVAEWVGTSGRSSVYDVKIFNDKNELVAIFSGRAHQTSKLVTDFLSGE